MRDHTPIGIKEFRGHFSRGLPEACPKEYALDELNVEFTEGGVLTRAGFDLSLSAVIGGWSGVCKRVFEYKKRGEVSRLLILDASGQIYDSSTTMLTPILTVAGMVDFSAITMFDRAYISPHDGNKGLSNEKVYVYDGVGVARVAAGVAPSGYTLTVVDSATSGNIEIGTHLFSVAFETASGHVTKFGLTGAEVKTYAAPGGKKADISTIPLGPAGTVARHIVVTKVQKDYDGNPKDKQWFFLPSGRIGDNTTTVLAGVNFFDSDLIVLADRLLNQLATIPAGSCITTYESSLVVGGAADAESTIRISDSGNPESFSDLEGFVHIDPGDSGGAVHQLIDHRGLLYIMKDLRTHATKSNGAAPSSWEVIPIDAAQGTGVHGASGVLDSKGHTLDMFLACTRSGLQKFTGSYGAEKELTYVIEDVWRRINPLYFKLVQISVDPVVKRVYISAPLDSAIEASHVLMGDFNEGLDATKIKWSVWAFPKKPTSNWVEVDFTTQRTKFRFGASDGGLYTRNPDRLNDFNTVIISFYRCGYVTLDSSGGVCHFHALRGSGIGDGQLELTVYGVDDVQVKVLPSITLSETPGRVLLRLMSFVNEEASLKFGVDSADEWFHITSMYIMTSVMWEEQLQSG